MERRNKTRIRRKNMGIKILILILILIFIIIKFVIPASVTFSRYVYSKVRNYYLYSKQFYFNSDKLSLEGAYFEADNWSGVDEYRVDITMNSKNNTLETTKVDIPYTLEYTFGVYHADGTAYTDKTPDELVYFGISKPSGTIYVASNNEDYFYFTIEPKVTLEDNDYVLVTVSANATSPYKQTISGTFKISIGNLGMKYQIEDEAHSPYFELTVTNTLNYYTVKNAFSTDTENYNVNDQISVAEYVKLSSAQKSNCKSMTIKLDFNPADVVIDTTSAMYLLAEDNSNYLTEGLQPNDFTYVNSITFDIDAEESKVIRFYKSIAKNDYTYPGDENPIVQVSTI